MFSHVAEETTRLAHGFLGALFGFMIVMSETNTIALIVLCTSLWVCFIFAAIFHYSLYKIVVEHSRQHLLHLVLSIVSLILTVVGVIIVFVFGFGLRVELEFSRELSFGLIVFTVFVIVMMFANVRQILEEASRLSVYEGR